MIKAALVPAVVGKSVLSIEAREACLQAQEARMGFYPAVLKTANGKKYVTNGLRYFVDQEEVKGKELLPAAEPWRNGYDAYTYLTHDIKPMLVLAKMG